MAVLDGETGDRTNADANAVTERLVTASFVQLVPTLSVDALAATRLLLASLVRRDVPFQVTRRTDAVPGGTTHVAVGCNSPSADVVLSPGSATTEAVAILDALGDHGVAGWSSVGKTFSAPQPADETPSVIGVPTPDDPTGLADATLVHGPFSSDPESAGRLLARGTGRDVATAVTIDTLCAGTTSPPLADAIETFLRARPTPDGPFATTAGTADVLDVLVDVDPGLAIALACGHDAIADRALKRWHTHSAAVHAAVEHAATTTGEIELDGDLAPVGATARLIRTVTAPDKPIIVRNGTRISVASPDPGDTDVGGMLAGPDRRVTDHGDGRVTIANWPADESPVEYLSGGDR